MIDIHCHIISQVDDGPTTETVSLTMARQAVAEGFTDIIATPHHLKGDYFNLRPDIMERVAKLNKLIKAAAIDLTIHVGQEIRIHGEIIAGLETGDLATLADSRYALIEFPTQGVPAFATQLFADIQMAGYVPIIAHPERNLEFINNPYRLYQFVMQGALTQLTWSSLAGKFGKKTKKASELFLENQLVHLIATDAHDALRRPLLHKKIKERLIKNIGPDYMKELEENERKVLQNQFIYTKDCSVPYLKKFGFFK